MNLSGLALGLRPRLALASPQPATVKFGYTRKELEEAPSRYLAPLKEGETMVRQGETLLPTPKLMDHIASEMLKDTLDSAGFVIVPMPMSLSKDPETMERFFEATYLGVKERVYQAKEHMFPKNPKLKKYHVQDGVGQQLDGFVLPSQKTLKRMHMDGNSGFFAHLYYPYVNVTGGDLKFFDFKRMMQEKNLTFPDIFEFDSPDFTPDIEPMIQSHQVDPSSPYTFEVSLEGKHPAVPPGSFLMVFVNNQHISHGVSETHFPQTGEFQRRFTRMSVSDKTFVPFWKQFMVNSKPKEPVLAVM